MRKKTIKSYFFNSSVRNPAVTALFCFSKKFVKQSRQLNKLRKTIRYMRNKKKRRDLLVTAMAYKRAAFKMIKFNQWSLNNRTTARLYLNSYYCNPTITKPILRKFTTLRKHLLLWFIFKHRYNRFKSIFIRKYPRTGVLSSHFVHILSKKNFTYQTRSKYRSKVYNLHNYQSYTHMYATFLHAYIRGLYDRLYLFTSNPAKATIWVDSDFYTQTSDWVQNTFNWKKTKAFININTPTRLSGIIPNPFIFTCSDWQEILNNWALISQFINELNPDEKEKVWTTLQSTLTPQALTLIPITSGLLLHDLMVELPDFQDCAYNYLRLYSYLIESAN